MGGQYSVKAMKTRKTEELSQTRRDWGDGTNKYHPGWILEQEEVINGKNGGM